jgi:hypothetical protein
VGICIGVCVAVSVAFVAAQLLPWLGWNTATGERWACFGSWALRALWASWRAPLHAARELLWLAAIVTAPVPLAHGLATGWWFWRSAAAGHGAPWAIDLGAPAPAKPTACGLPPLTTRRSPLAGDALVREKHRPPAGSYAMEPRYGASRRASSNNPAGSR